MLGLPVTLRIAYNKLAIPVRDLDPYGLVVRDGGSTHDLQRYENNTRWMLSFGYEACECLACCFLLKVQVIILPGRLAPVHVFSLHVE